MNRDTQGIQGNFRTDSQGNFRGQGIRGRGRCAIYTRKSHEEGLDQPFNSLDAQRQAAIDYISSQRHEGWQALNAHYDDGGFTGGNTQRPALQQLLKDINSSAIDVVVVYKVDRLSRSLHDFAQMMRLFDEHNVSFVSVTQPFNTTTSMGRLTLNVLLSFAQFEREVTGERIRDKLAATKKQGLWVTGQPPLGYRVVNRQLVAVPDEAELVKKIFEGYQHHPSLIELANQLNQDGHTTKRWCSTRDRWHGGRKLTPQYLRSILTNRIFIGKIVHKDKVWPGKHEPIVDQTLWDRVHKSITKQQRRTQQHFWNHPHLLKGKLRTHEGYAISPGSVQRPSQADGRPKRLVRYYVSQIKKMPLLTNLGPSILHSALAGNLPPSLTLKNLLDASQLLDWQRQLAYLNLPYPRA